MGFDLRDIRNFLIPCVLYVIAAIVAFFALQDRDWFLPVLFLLLPFFDLQWRMPQVAFDKRSLTSWAIPTVIIILLLDNRQLIDMFIVMVLVAAIPEEWFFRAYMQKQFGNHTVAVLIVSLLFSLLHYIAHNTVVAWLVFIPSVFFGWIYKKTDDLILIVGLHALSNLIFYIYLKPYIMTYWSIHNL